ncbi:MAG TPA: Hsp20/alpha crystallin family protein [Gemmataceae bacterium]|jgi:HSP20 family protein
MADTALQQQEATGTLPAEVTRGVTYTPRVDILETEDELLLFADLPGVTEGDVDIRFENGELTLHARRVPAKRNGAVLWENEAGDFFRAFRISEQVDANKIWAELKNGVLTLHLPKVEAAKPRKIAVRGG